MKTEEKKNNEKKENGRRVILMKLSTWSNGPVIIYRNYNVNAKEARLFYNTCQADEIYLWSQYESNKPNKK